MARARRGGGVQQLCVRATPLQHRGRALGWVLLLEEDKVAGAVADAPVLFQGMWSRDRGMKRLFPLVEKVAGSEANALVRGETGAGKELVARALHALSPRASAPFRVIGCATLPPHLLEGELFGQASGAVGDIAGGFRLTEGGTLFLDEVAALPLELQARLLRVLETGTVIPSGAREPVPVNVRLVAGTQRNLRREVDAGRFRADLMYRLDVVPVAVPPLRARPGDVMLLAEKFVEAVNARGGRRIERIAPGVRAMLERHDWPGNVRELRNVIEYAFVVGEGPVLLESDLPPELHEPSPAARALGRRVHARALGTEALTKSPEGVRIRRAIERADGNRERAAQILGISRVTLWRRMKALGLAAAQEMED
jgi:DNA-binding NtrC family response regulator